MLTVWEEEGLGHWTAVPEYHSRHRVQYLLGPNLALYSQAAALTHIQLTKTADYVTTMAA